MLRSAKPDPTMPNRDTYIPPHIQNAMANHVQQSMPAHLQKYRGGNTYIPQHAQAEMAQHLENTLPKHMQQYAGAYMEQHVVQPSLARRGSTTPPSPPPEPSHTPPSPTNPVPATPVNTPSPDEPYDFITHPQQVAQQPGLANLIGGSSLLVRIALLGAGLLVLLVLFIVIRGIFSSSPSLDSFVPVVQEQQAILRIVSNAEDQQGNLSANNQNVAATVSASLSSSQSATIKYLANNKKKINEKQLNFKVSPDTKKQLAESLAAGTYNQTFHDALESKLTAYSKALDAAYNQNPGPKGKELLTDSYRQLQLMQTQLKETPAN